MSLLRSAAVCSLFAISSIASAATSDIQVTKTTSSTGAPPGGVIVYTITVHNNGPDAATNVDITDVLSPLVNFEDLNTLLPCSTPTRFSSGTVQCLATTLAAGGNEVITLSVRVAPNVAGGTIENSVSAVSQSDDPNSGNSSASAPPVPVLPPSADLTIVKATQSTIAPTGTIVEYGIFIRNNGPSTATNVVVTDTLPAGLELVSATMIGGTCTGTTTITCNQSGSLVSSQPNSVTLRARVTATSGTVTNTATVSASQSDPNLANNSSTKTLPVTAPTIPTMSTYALIALALALGAIAFTRTR